MDTFKSVARSESDIFADLSVLCRKPGYAHAIAYFCFRDNFLRFNGVLSSDAFANQHRESCLIRTEIATLIGLLVRGEIDMSLPNPDAIGSYIHRTEGLLEEIHAAMMTGWFKVFDSTGAEEPISDPFSVADNLREPIFYSAESAYSFQYSDLARLRYQGDDAWLEINKGFSIADAVAVVRALEVLVTDQQAAVLQGMHGSPLEEWTILPAFQFTAQKVSNLAGIALDRTEAVLTAFTLPEGNQNPTFTGIGEINATNATPILKMRNGEYLLFQHYSLLEALYESPIFWMRGDRAYEQVAILHRGAFTEQFSAERLRSVFGRERVLTNITVHRTPGKALGEIDVLVLFGDRAIIVQAKSKRLTIEARKGNDLRLKDDFKKAVQDAYDQAYICAAAITEPSITLKDAAGQAVILPTAPRVTLPLCIVGDHYPALAFQARQFLKARITEKILSPLVTDVFTLDVMAEMLSSPLHFLHYLHLRARFGEKFLVAHELTLLSYHLAQNLWGGDFDMMALDHHLSVDLDIAMLARRQGVAGRATPEGILTKHVGTTFGRLIQQIESDGDPKLTDLGIWLLSLNEGTARDLSNGIDRIAMMTRQDKEQHDITIAVADPASGLTIHCSYDPAPEATRKLMAHAELRKHSMKADVWYALLVKPDDGSILMGAMVRFPWQPNRAMDIHLQKMPRPITARAFHREVTKTRKIGRNERCPCGSGMKYKLCCLNS